MSWALNAGQLITQAYRKIGNLTPPWVPSEDQMSQGIIALNAMLKGWMVDGISLYRQEQITLTVPAGVGYAGNPYDISPIILGLEEARLVIQPAPNLYERELGIYAYGDYMQLPNKLSQGLPSIICFDKQATTSGIYLWPLPTLGCTINATIGKMVNDVVLPSDAVDFPVEWTEGAIFNLADRIMDDNGVAAADPVTAQRITDHAVLFYRKLLDFDRPASTFFRPFGRAGSGRFWR